MNKDEINLWVESLPSNHGLYRNNPTSIPGSDWHFECLGYAQVDPSFVWVYVKECVALGILLPDCANTEPAREAFMFLKTGDRSNKPLMAALTYHANSARMQRAAMEALLKSKDVTMDDVARIMNLSIEAVTMFEQLFFNVRDRLDEAPYTNQIVFPHSRQVLYQRNYVTNADPRDLALRAAHDSGSEAAMHILGSPEVNSKGLNESQLSGNLRKTVLANAECAARGGMLHQPTYILGRGLSLISSEIIAGGGPGGSKPQQVGIDLSDAKTMGNAINQSLTRENDEVYHENAINEALARLAISEKVLGVTVAPPPSPGK